MNPCPLFNLTALALTTTFLTACGDSAGPTTDAPAGDGPAVTGNVLTTEIPQERIEGTPLPMKVPNLVQAPGQAPSLVVPEGSTLISAGKPVTASDDLPIVGELEYITDGDKDAGEGFYVELIDGLQWVQIDLEAAHQVDAIWVWHYHSQRRAYHNVVVQISDDASFETGVTTVFNNDHENLAGQGKGTDAPYVESHFGKLIDAKGQTGRYVRLYQNGNTSNEMNHYTEVEVFGRPAQ